MSRDPTLIFGPLDICTVNHRPPVGLCLDSNEDRGTGTREHFANLDQMAIWSRYMRKRSPLAYAGCAPQKVVLGA